ncbi:MAG: SusD/RagB family nutrient-binding outer membrane lipoprotein [Bacteroidota bacterium]|nr:SusD/RagB family nutrient-binding outer membrane lipoprotein [Bacteroidota bacterium]
MKTKYLLILLVVFFGFSCTENFEAFNTNEKNPTDVEGEYLFTQAQKELSDQLSSTNVNWNIWKLSAQYWTETTYLNEEQFDVVNRNIPEQIYRAYYRNVMKPLDEATTLISEDALVGQETEAQKANKLAIIELLNIYSYQNLVNVFGDVPYTEALDAEIISPVYDDAAGIYADLLIRINAALASMDDSEPSFPDADIIYGGNTAAWVAFGNSLKLKLAINLADIDESTAQSNAEDAVADGVFTSGADNALFAYMSNVPNTNPLHEDLVLSGRSDFVASRTIVDMMNNLDDPRRANYFAQNMESYVGGINGESSAFASYTHINDYIQSATFPGILLTYDEVQFYIAEAAARTWDVGQTAEEAYGLAVTASFDFWGTEGAADYLTDDAPFDGYATWQEAIGEQAYIAFYTRGLVAYTEWRRLDQPTLNTVTDAVTGGDPATRFTYPVNEQTLNSTNYDAASSAIGGDQLMTKIFWDVN